MEDDAAIINLFFARSEQAIQALNGKYGAMLQRLSRNIVHSEQDAEECVNDAYLGAWNAIPPARPEPLLAYICKIVRNLSLKCCAKKGAAKRGAPYAAALDELAECLAGPGSVEDALETRELARMIEEFLNTLSAENRAIFLRRYWFADPCRAIGVRVGMTEEAVRVRLARQRQKLRDYLKERGVLV